MTRLPDFQSLILQRFPASRGSGSRGSAFRSLVWLLGFALAACSTPRVAWAEDWRFPRGDSAASGAVSVQLPEKLSLAWEFKADEAIETTPVVAGDRVFAGDVFGTLYAISRTDGKELWRKKFDTGFLASPIVSDEAVVIGDIEGSVYALEPGSGDLKWKQTTGGEVNGAASFYKDMVLVTSQDGKLYSFRVDDGKPVWTYVSDDQIRCAPTIAGDRTFLGGCDGKLHIVDLAKGTSDGEPLPLGGPTGSTPAIEGDRAIVPAMDGSVFAFDWKNHKQLWRYDDPVQAQEYRNSAAVTDKLAVVSSQRKHVDAIDLETGKRVWRHTLRRRADASPVIAGKDVWIPASDGRLIRLSLADGKEKWVHEVRGSYLAGVAITDSELIVADDDGIVRCFRGK